MSQRTLRIGFALSLGLNVAFFVLLGLMVFSPHLVMYAVFNNFAGDDFRERMIRVRIRSVGRELDLTPRQWEQIDPLIEQAFADGTESRIRIRMAERELLQHIIQHPDDDTGIEIRRTRLEEALSSTGDRFTEALRQVVPLLTPEQIDQFDQMVMRRNPLPGSEPSAVGLETEPKPTPFPSPSP